MYQFPYTGSAFDQIMQIKQSTDNAGVLSACEDALTALGENAIAIPDDVDPTASLKDRNVKIIQQSIDELNNAAQARNDEDVSEAVDNIVNSFLAVLAAINAA